MTTLYRVSGRILAAALIAGFVVGVPGAGSAGAQSSPWWTAPQKIAASQEPLDINTATAAQLKALPGMGNAYVQRVIAGRPYSAKNQLTMRGVIPSGTYDKIKDQIIAHRVKK